MIDLLRLALIVIEALGILWYHEFRLRRKAEKLADKHFNLWRMADSSITSCIQGNGFQTFYIHSLYHEMKRRALEKTS